jgi:hypothetical protein
MEPTRSIQGHKHPQSVGASEPEPGEISEIRAVSEIRDALARTGQSEVEPAYTMTDPLEGDALSTSPRHRSEHPCAFDSIAFVQGSRVLTITWLPPAP